MHDRTIQLPFYRRLIELKNVSAEEMLAHFVNNSAIFGKLETVIKANKAFQKIIGEDLYRCESAEKDIAFFMRTFQLERPNISSAAQRFLNYIDDTVQSNSDLLLAILYVQYAGLFLGRTVCEATEVWLKGRIKNWDALPQEDRGVSYWNFRGLASYEDRERAKNRVMKGINEQGDKLGLNDALKMVALRTFEHNFRIIQSVSPPETTQRKIQDARSQREFVSRL